MTKSDTIDAWLRKHLGIGTSDAAKKLGYAEPEQLIASRDWDGLKRKYPVYYESIETNTHQADNRTVESFAETLVGNWVIEDIMGLMLSKGGLEVKKTGADAGRHILRSANVTEEPDMEVHTKDGYRQYIEVVTDYSMYWKRNGRLSLRDNKFFKCRDSKALILAISMEDETFTIVDPNNASVANGVSYEWGGKPVSEINLDGYMWLALSKSNLGNAIDYLIREAL